MQLLFYFISPGQESGGENGPYAGPLKQKGVKITPSIAYLNVGSPVSGASI